MYIHPKSFLSRLLGGAWTVLLIAVLLWIAAQLLADVWGWLVGILVVTVLVRLGIWAWRWRSEAW
jgi:membrane protein insertase Oxa1/YidC/SpoIIIJ